MDTLVSYSSDALLSNEGDILFADGDIRLVFGIEFLKKEIFKLLITEKRDWKLFPSVGASLTKFNGYINSRETAEEVKKHIKSSITPFITPYVVNVEVIPIDYETVKCYILIGGADLPAQEVMLFELNYQDVFTYVDYDPAEDTLLSEAQSKTNTQGSLLHPNKFADRLRNQ